MRPSGTSEPPPASRLGVLGTLVWDRIHHPALGATPREQWGGLLYALAALVAARPAGWVIEPLVKVGRDMRGAADALVAALGCDAATLVSVSEPNNRVDLHYRDEARRDEVLRGGVPGWRWTELEPRLAALDALYLNFLAGNELALEEAEALRAGWSGPIYADLHSLFLGPASDAPREPRPLVHAERWLRCFDMVQLNEDEAALLCPGEPAERFLERMVAGGGPACVAVTRGAAGVTLWTRAGVSPAPAGWGAGRGVSGAVRRHDLAAEARAGDPTGCGDVWGATCFARLLAGDHWDRAARAAHRAAARKLGCGETERLAEHLAEAAADA